MHGSGDTIDDGVGDAESLGDTVDGLNDEGTGYFQTQEQVVNKLRTTKPYKLWISISRDSSVAMLQQLVCEKLGWVKSWCVEVFASKIHKIFDGYERITTFGSTDEIWIYQLPDTDSIVPTSLISSSYRYGTPKLPPMMISLPTRVVFDQIVGIEAGRAMLGKKVYHLAVETLARFGKVPFFRRIGTEITRRDLERLEDVEGMVSFGPMDGFEAIPDLFGLEMVENRIGGGTSCVYEVGEAGSPASGVSELVREIDGTSMDGIKEYVFPVDSVLSVVIDGGVAEAIFCETAMEMVGRRGREKTVTVEMCMAEFTKQETLDGNDCVFCTRCKIHQPTRKQLSVYSLPEVFVCVDLDSCDSFEKVLERWTLFEVQVGRSCRGAFERIEGLTTDS